MMDDSVQKSEHTMFFTLKKQGSQHQLSRNGFDICKVTIPATTLDENDQKHTLDPV